MVGIVHRMPYDYRQAIGIKYRQPKQDKHARSLLIWGMLLVPGIQTVGQV